MKNLKRILFTSLIGAVSIGLCFPALSEETLQLGEGIDCTDISVDVGDSAGLTREERIRLMDKALRDSLDKFEYCQSRKNNRVAGVAKNGGGADSGGGPSTNTDLGSNQNTTGESVASTVMSGTESITAPATREDGVAGESEEQKSNKQQSDSNVALEDLENSSNGKLPEDIPSPENDDILASQIRYAAQQETDPVKKKQLWNEYRKYKGLAVKN